jgi:hypothetical protein
MPTQMIGAHLRVHVHRRTSSASTMLATTSVSSRSNGGIEGDRRAGERVGEGARSSRCRAAHAVIHATMPRRLSNARPQLAAVAGVPLRSDS